jgi:ketosteroid isomerase-like protein
MKYHLTRFGAGLVTFILGVTLAGSFAFDKSGGRDERAVLAVEREYVRAHLERDVEALDRVLADDFTSFGGRVKKGHRLALLANPLFTVVSLETEGVEVSVQGDEARVDGRAKMKSSFRGREVTTPWYGFTRRYERRQGRWQIVSCHFSLRW